MRWGWTRGIGSLGGLAALSACMPIYDQSSYAPPLPPPPPAAYSDQESPDDYRWIDRADALWEAIGNAPPDHAFAFEGAEPWAWVTEDGYTIVVEDGAAGIRSYYFEPGSGAPFLAVEPGMSFGFEGPTVAVVYGPDGGAMPRSDGAAYLDRAMALYARGQQLKAAMMPQTFAMVDSAAWVETSVYLSLFRERWSDGRRRHPGWRRHRDGAQMRDWQVRLARERLRRAGQAEAFRRWREGGFHGTPPGRFHRPGDRRPDAGRPRQPGQGWDRGGPPRQPGARPPRFERPGVPPRPRKIPEGFEPPAPVDAAPEAAPGAAPRPPRPDRPGWGRRPRSPDQPGVVPAPNAGGASQPERPRWPRGEGARPDWSRRQPPAVTPSGAAPLAPAPRPAWRPEPGASRPDRSFTPAPAPRAAPPPRAEPRQPPPSRPAPVKHGGTTRPDDTNE